MPARPPVVTIDMMGMLLPIPDRAAPRSDQDRDRDTEDRTQAVRGGAADL